MFGTTAVPQTVPAREWTVQQAPGMAPLSLLLDEARRTNELLRSVLNLLCNRLEPLRADDDPPAPAPAASAGTVAWCVDLSARIDWLERQLEQIKEKLP